LVSNIILTLPETTSQREIEAALDIELEALLAAYRESAAEWIVVSNEVGLGLVPSYALGRIYRDALGRANQRLASAAERVILMVAGIPMTVK
jgi:adenosylcobinamide kinase/adenosylcobinamide-phosphate guanylyltransferase